ncbi:unnamed protein product [Blepharisma stoltei]|uniref:Uncharacterized protein n=1 Tax=Blepharisma stoltei TaxID=1481888 RepID=A0AAU9J5B3_9CILI|nr:unnamed protein product [Blepharisma stoltei]
MKEKYVAICEQLRVTPNSSVLKAIEEEPDLFFSDRFALPLNYLGNRGTLAVLPFLYDNSALRSLNLRNQGLKSECAMELAELFRYHPGIASIDLSHNRIGSNGGQSLMELFENNENIKILNVEDNPMDWKIIKKITELQKTREKKKTHHVPRDQAKHEQAMMEWLNINIEESGSLAPIFTPSPSQTILSLFSAKDERMHTQYDHEDTNRSLRNI